ncbi:trehalose-phosphate phosphatase [Medicago truncatula]|uniref:Trehalose-phosphate phosphatase n=1 Tax=Medicago truncatula TaxID=3880 RepID=G7JD41_MEDTR|nr:trehalose-phosphate phosphatase [Medicago truncatula]
MYNTNGKQTAVFLDYDGTFSPIVADPDKAYMSKKDLARHFPMAFVSGRWLDKLCWLNYTGSHGMDIKGPTNRRSNKKSASEFLPIINEVRSF